MRATPLFLLSFALCLRSAPADTTINDTEKFAWGANIGWLNWQGDLTSGAAIGEYVVSGFIWGANVGWIHLGDGTPANGLQYVNDSATDFGVNVQDYVVSGAVQKAALRGFAYGANIGWINFENSGNPEIDLGTGRLSGFAWGANVGWINLGTFSGSVQTNALAPGTDSDGDGIPDAFELRFTNPDSLTILTAAGDADGDGESDVAEYLANTNPLNPVDLLKITALAANLDGSQFTLTWTSNPARRYRIQEDADLELPPAFITTINDILPSGAATTTRNTGSASGEMRFFRVQSILPLTP